MLTRYCPKSRKRIHKAFLGWSKERELKQFRIVQEQAGYVRICKRGKERLAIIPSIWVKQFLDHDQTEDVAIQSRKCAVFPVHDDLNGISRMQVVY